MTQLDEQFWSDRYRNDNTGWDLGQVSTPLKAYFDQLINKDLKILIPGCGNAYEAAYLHQLGFTDVHVLDLSQEPLNAFIKNNPSFPQEHVHQGNFLKAEGCYDLIIEQTLFCAIDPSLRQEYAVAASNQLKEGGKLVGVMFGREFESGPPFGGTEMEYQKYFTPHFSEVKFEECYNSIEPRKGSELFVQLTK